jgi:phosphotriesterase-related protein
MVDVARAGLKRLTELGVDTLVDVTVIGIGRNLPRVVRAAEGLDLNIVVATGAYYFDALPGYFARPEGAAAAPDPLERLFVGEIEQGIAETGVKAGVIKVASDAKGMLPGPERVFRAAARAHLRTDVPITTHTDAATRGGRAQQDVLREEGVDLARVVIGHCGDTTDLDYLKELMDNGSYIGMDRFGYDALLPVEERLQTIFALCEQGYADRMVLSHDTAYSLGGFMSPESAAELQLPKHTFISETILAELRARGVSDGQIQQMMVDNPRRVLSRDGG